MGNVVLTSTPGHHSRLAHTFDRASASVDGVLMLHPSVTVHNVFGWDLRVFQPLDRGWGDIKLLVSALS